MEEEIILEKYTSLKELTEELLTLRFNGSKKAFLNMSQKDFDKFQKEMEEEYSMFYGERSEEETPNITKDATYNYSGIELKIKVTE